MSYDNAEPTLLDLQTKLQQARDLIHGQDEIIAQHAKEQDRLADLQDKLDQAQETIYHLEEQIAERDARIEMLEGTA